MTAELFKNGDNEYYRLDLLRCHPLARVIQERLFHRTGSVESAEQDDDVILAFGCGLNQIVIKSLSVFLV